LVISGKLLTKYSFEKLGSQISFSKGSAFWSRFFEIAKNGKIIEYFED
jgi:hypothetical protein